MNRNVRVITIGRIVSNIGDSIFFILFSFYLYKETENVNLLMLFNIALTLPRLLEGFLFKNLDKYPKKLTIILTMSIQLLIIFVFYLFLDNIFEGIWLAAGPLLLFVFVLMNITTYYVSQETALSSVDEDHVESVNKIMQISGVSLNIIIDALAPLMLIYFTLRRSIEIDILTFLVAIVFFTLIRKPSKQELKVEESPSIKFSNLVSDKKLLIIASSIIFIIGALELLTLFSLPFFAELDLSEYYTLLGVSVFVGVIIGNIFSSLINTSLKLIVTLFLPTIFLVLLSIYPMSIFMYVSVAVTLGITSGIIDPLMSTFIYKNYKGNFINILSKVGTLKTVMEFAMIGVGLVVYNLFGYRGLYTIAFAFFVVFSYLIMKSKFIFVRSNEDIKN